METRLILFLLLSLVAIRGHKIILLWLLERRDLIIYYILVTPSMPTRFLQKKNLKLAVLTRELISNYVFSLWEDHIFILNVNGSLIQDIKNSLYI